VTESASLIFVGSKISKFFVAGEVRLISSNAKDFPTPPPAASTRFKLTNAEILEQLAPNLNYLVQVGPGEFECKESLFSALQTTPTGFVAFAFPHNSLLSSSPIILGRQF